MTTTLNGVLLSMDGEEALIALLRYVVQHGNVTISAGRTARLLLQVMKDTSPVISFDGITEQRRLARAWEAIHIDREKTP